MNPPAPSSSNSPVRGVSLEVRNLRKTYAGEEVIKGVSFQVQPGEIFVIMGPSGSGKTVLLKQIIGLEVPDQGEILVDGQPILSDGVAEKYRMAMVFQSGALLNSLTVAENVGLYLTEHRLKSPQEVARIVAEKLEIVGLSGEEDRYPAELSGGMKKRVAIARSLVIDPHLILYDEPTSELDPLMAVTIAEEIVSLNKRSGATSVVVSHDRDLAFGIASRIAVMRDGSIVFIGTPLEVQQRNDPFLQKFLRADLNVKQT